MCYLRRKIKYSIGLGLVCLILSGCATLGKPLSIEYKRSIRNLAIVSVMGDSFELNKIGTTVFNNEHYKDNSSNLAADSKIEISLEKYLKSSSSFNTLIMSDLREEFRGAFGYQSKPKQSLERLRGRLKKIKSEGIDAVLIVSPDFSTFEDSPVTVVGYGICVRTFLMMWYAKTYFISRFTLVDTATQEIVFERTWWWWKDIKFSKWQRSFSELTATEQEEIKGFLNNVIDSDIPKFIKRFNF